MRPIFVTTLSLALLLTPLAFADPVAQESTNRVDSVQSRAWPDRVNRDAILAKVNAIAVLDFHTDRPVHQARLIVNGKTVGTEGMLEPENGLKVAVVPSAKEIVIHFQIGNAGSYLKGEYPRPVLANLFEKITYGPGKKLVLADWTEVYSIKHILQGKVTYTLSFQVK